VPEQSTPGWGIPVAAATGIALVVLATLGLHLALLVVAVILQALFLVYFARHLAFVVSANRSAPPDLSSPPAVDTSFVPRVSVLVACKNEATVIGRLVESLLALDYPGDKLQLVVCDDASTDGTGDLLDDLAHRNPRLEAVHRPPGGITGKSAALNEALPRLTGEVIVIFDADHCPRPDVIRRLASHFRDPHVGAVQGRCQISNADDSLLARLVAIDYLAGYLVNEYGRQSLFQLPAYGGANCAVRASSLRALGGWNPRSVTEDTDLTMRILLRGERVRFDVHAVDEEEGVVTFRRFWKQRYRWARGHQQVWRDYRRAVWHAPSLSLAQKIETTMFLLVFHVPVGSAVGLVLAGLWILGLQVPGGLPVSVFWTLLFLGPLLELGSGLLLARASRRDAVVLAFFVPLFVTSAALCTKAWFDGLVGRDYGWVKTARAAEPTTAPVSR